MPQDQENQQASEATEKGSPASGNPNAPLRKDGLAPSDALLVGLPGTATRKMLDRNPPAMEQSLWLICTELEVLCKLQAEQTRCLQALVRQGAK